ncbi:MAG: alanine--tRNA ligase, partial [Bacteroidales bacterium]|nr:alanine--tRNA ligase [Bacteroidales bacterium]
YDTDVFQPLIQEIARKAGVPYGQMEEADVAMRVIADHLRAVSFSIADGQLPSNAKAGYVIRRILRRAVRYGYTFLGFKQPFINELVDCLVAQMGVQYPELVKQQELIRRIILEEEQSFLKTLANGIGRFEDYIARNTNDTHTIDGVFAFELFDTYGFPIDLTQLMASEKGWTVDMEGFQKGLAEQKQRSRAAAAVENDDWVEILPEVGQEFVGYDTLAADVRITRYRHVKVKDRELYQLVLDKTPFYGESGGQVGDCGILTAPSGLALPVISTKKENNLIVHIVPADKFEVLIDAQGATIGTQFRAEVDKCRRYAIECNHTATHLLHKALRNVLGTHVEQKGSSVDEQRLRFDFSHFARLSREEIREVERLVNIDIRHAIALEEHRAMPIAEAQKLGAMALFGEKYGERVRVVKFGDSVEFCGGTHIANTGRIGSFRIVSEGAVAAGMRRIEAVTGATAEQYNNSLQDSLDTLREMLKGPKDIVAAVQRLQDDNTELRAQLDRFQKQQVANFVKDIANHVKDNPQLVMRVEADLSPLKDAMLSMRAQYPDMAVVLASDYGGKPSLMVCLGQNRVDAGKDAALIVRTAGKEMQGGGGGQPAYATAGGKNLEGLDRALHAAAAML